MPLVQLMTVEAARLLDSSGQPIKNGKQVAELLGATQQTKQLAIIKIPGYSKATTTEAKGNHSAAPRQEALSHHIVQTREYALLPAKSIRHSFTVPKGSYRSSKEDVATKGGPLTQQLWLRAQGKPVSPAGAQLPPPPHVRELTRRHGVFRRTFSHPGPQV